MTLTAESFVTEAWKSFGDWCAKHDPDGDLSPLQQVEAYCRWCGERAALKTAKGAGE